MTAIDRWLVANDRYLKAELRALRRRLEALAQRDAPAPIAPIVTAGGTGLREWFRWRTTSARAEPVAAPIAATAGPEPIEEPPDAADATHVPALLVLAQRLGLSDFERQTLLLCAAMEFDTGFGALCAQAQPNVARQGPTFALALAALDAPAWDVMSPERPLRYWRLIEIARGAHQPLIGSPLAADERIVNYIKGLNYLDDLLTPLVRHVPEDADALPPSQATLVDTIVSGLERAHAAGAAPPLIQLLGTAPGSTLAIAQAVAARLGLSLYRLPVETLPTATSDTETFARLWQREAALLPIALLVDAAALDPGNAAQRQAVDRLLAHEAGLVMLATPNAWGGFGRASSTYTVARPLASEQKALWLAAGTIDDGHAALLAGQFDLDHKAIATIAARAADADATLWAGALDHARPTLDLLAQPVTPRVGWDAIELPPREMAQLHAIAAQVRHRSAVYDDMGFRDRLTRGLGISVLFAGESGTGKTMAAEALANDLDLLLYRIDLSAVVSKFIGETEKNLRRLFDAADDGGAILLFDEADALFGKRSEVKDSHDRYANIEVNYLLQRMESYRGLAILTTNMRSALDAAFVRRLRFIVTFPFPGVRERGAIWRTVFPPALDVAALDFDRLARLNLTGGSIHNIALNAAFLAAASGGAVTMPLVLDAARSEFVKLERPTSDADFRILAPVEATA